MKFKDKRAIFYLLDALLLLVFFSIVYSNDKDSLSLAKLAKSKDTQVSQSISVCDENSIDYKQEMQDWVIKISIISKSMNPDFIIIPQNCTELFTTDGKINSPVQYDFLDSIDGVVKEGLSYGYDEFDAETNPVMKKMYADVLNIAKDNNKKVIALDYCMKNSKINKANKFNDDSGFIGFISHNPELTSIPNSTPYKSNDNNIETLQDAQNCIFLLNPQEYNNSDNLVISLSQTNYDVIFIDLFFKNEEMISKAQINMLKTKPNGSKRLVISYLNISEAEDNRYYFDSSYNTTPPSWLLDKSPIQDSNYIVEYWNADWQAIITSGQDSYLQRIINSGFDGVYLDAVDSYKNFE